MIKNFMHKLISNKKYLFMFIVLIGLLSITIGSALISSTLSLTGNSKINKNSWVIYFDGIRVSSDSVETDSGAHIVDREKTQIDFSVDLKNPGDFYEFTVDTVNDGTIDACIEEVTKTELTDAQKEYLNFYVEYIDVDINEANNDETIKQIKACDRLPAGTRRKIVAYVELKKDADLDKYPEADTRLNLSFAIKYVQKCNCATKDNHVNHRLRIDPNGGTYQDRIEPRDIYLRKFVPNEEDDDDDDEKLPSKYTVETPVYPYHNFKGWTFDVTPEESGYTFVNNEFEIGNTDVTMTAQWEEIDAVARIMWKYYPTIQEAFDDAGEGWDDNTVWLLKDTTEYPTNDTRTPFVFNLDGHTVTGQITTNPGTDITLINGRVEGSDTVDTAFVNKGKLTIGENDGMVDVDNSIALVASDAGLENTAGSEFYFYDGYIEGFTGIKGAYNYTELAPNHYLVSDYIFAIQHQKLYLVRDPSRAVARTTTGGTIYYYDLPEAIQKAEGSKTAHTPEYDNEYVIDIIRNFEAAYDDTVHQDKRIIIETNGYDISIGKEFVNNGYLVLNNNKTAMNKIKPSKTINNTGTLVLNNTKVSVTTNSPAIRNTNTLNMNNSIVEGNSSYGVSNEGNGKVNLDDDSVLTASNS